MFWGTSPSSGSAAVSGETLLEAAAREGGGLEGEGEGEGVSRP